MLLLSGAACAAQLRSRSHTSYRTAEETGPAGWARLAPMAERLSSGRALLTEEFRGGATATAACAQHPASASPGRTRRLVSCSAPAHRVSRKAWVALAGGRSSSVSCGQWRFRAFSRWHPLREPGARCVEKGCDPSAAGGRRSVRWENCGSIDTTSLDWTRQSVGPGMVCRILLSSCH